LSRPSRQVCLDYRAHSGHPARSCCRVNLGRKVRVGRQTRPGRRARPGHPPHLGLRVRSDCWACPGLWACLTRSGLWAA